ncbi:MAG: hypothetical protein M3N68_14195 [Actinomycetota bacterium]|nr:hypothetical protein [Actinomycetota bacterium]
MLAWHRTGLSALLGGAVALRAASSSARWGYVPLGIGLLVLGIGCEVVAQLRSRLLAGPPGPSAALPAPLARAVALVVTAAGALAVLLAILP